MKKTVRVPVAADGVPIVAPKDLDKTREVPACGAADGSATDESAAQAAPREILDDVTVPVQSSLESTVTFELLRRQSIQVDDEDDDGNKR
jgi:hypothetical protein